MGTDPHDTGGKGDVSDEGLLLQGIWNALERRAVDQSSDAPTRGPEAGSQDEPGTREATRQDLPSTAPLPAADADGPDHPEHDRLLHSASAVHALNQRLSLDMEVPAHRLARDRLTAFVAKVSALTGVRPDELVIGSGSEAFVVQNDAAGRTIARFDTHDAVNTPVGQSLGDLAAASRMRSRDQQSQQAAAEQALPAPLLRSS